MSNRHIIEAARKRFDAQLHTTEYKRIHADNEQLAKLVELIDIQKGKKYLDLGTGNGYVAFSLAKRYSDIVVYGLDIASNSIEKNNEMCEDENIENLHFQSYNGIDFPFESGSFLGSISRYAFHHFPNVNHSISEIRRVLEPTGFFILSDPLMDEDDCENFVDQFQMQIQDGHVHFYRKPEIEKIFRENGFLIEKEFESSIRYPRQMNRNYEELFERTQENVLHKYKIEIVEDNVYITVRVMNIMFRKD